MSHRNAVTEEASSQNQIMVDQARRTCALVAVILRAKDARKEDCMNLYFNHRKIIAFPTEFQKLGLIDASYKHDEMPSMKHPDFDRLRIYVHENDFEPLWNVQFDGMNQHLILSTEQVCSFLKFVWRLLSKVQDFEGDGGTLNEYILALLLVSNNIDLRIGTALGRIKEGEK